MCEKQALCAAAHQGTAQDGLTLTDEVGVETAICSSFFL